MNVSSDRTSEFARDLGDAVRRNPVSAALIGMGMVWLFAGRNRLSDPIQRVSGVADAAQDVWRGATSNVKAGSDGVQERIAAASDAVRNTGANLVEGISDRGSRFAESMSDYAGSIPDAAGSMLGDIKTNMSEMFRAQPLALGAVGLAIGAAIAASLPRTETETEYLGETSDFVQQKASEIAAAKAREAANLGEKVVDAMADEARKQGLTTEGLKSTASELSEKVSRVAGSRELSTPQQ
jgi:hypothetical protein